MDDKLDINLLRQIQDQSWAGLKQIKPAILSLINQLDTAHENGLPFVCDTPEILILLSALLKIIQCEVELRASSIDSLLCGIEDPNTKDDN